MSTLSSIQSLIKQDRLTEALTLLNAHLSQTPDDPAALFLRGKVHWRLGDRTQAQNDYLASAALDPTGPATAALESARTIESFFNPDLLNP